MKKIVNKNKWAAALVLGVFSMPASAALIGYDATLDACDDGGSGACGFLGVVVGSRVEAYMDVPDGPTGPIAPADISGFNPDAGVLFADGLLLTVGGLGSFLSEPTASTLVIDANNAPVSGFVESVWFETPGSATGRSILTTIDADGTFLTEFRNGDLSTAVVFTSSGSGVFSDHSTVIPVPAAVWLFGSGLLGLVGMARRRAAA